jgi:MoxR-vWA-beta-propeller ternary system domain bpX2/FtsH ternary system domain X7
VKGAWAVRIPPEKAVSAGSLRLRAGVLVCTSNDGLWLRGEHLTEELELELRKLPKAQRFSVGEAGALTPDGARIPRGSLPDAEWQPLSAWLTPAPQPPAFAGRTDRRVTLRLVRADHEEPATVLVTTLNEWCAYASNAPLVRLRRLRFATAADGRTAVRGDPLPPVPESRYVERDGVAVPCGFRLSPDVDAPTVRKLLATEADDLALFHDDGSWERIAAADFVAAARGAARATVQAAHEPRSG